MQSIISLQSGTFINVPAIQAFIIFAFEGSI